MLRALFVALTFVVALAAAAWAQLAPGDRDLSLANHSSRAINEVYVSPSAVDQWGEDRLGEQTLAPGHSVHLRLGHLRDCEFDIQVVYEDASREEAHNVNLCRSPKLNFDGSSATPAAPVPTHDVTIINRSARPIQQVLISPSEAGDWGDDRLGDRSISVGDSATVRYQGGCSADVRVVFDNRSAEERRSIDLCIGPQLAIEPGWTTADQLPATPAHGTEATVVSVTNHAGHAAAALFLFAEGSADPGPDLLGSNGLDDGATVSITFQRPPDTCRFTAHVVFGGKRADETITGLDLCRNTAFELPPRT